MHNFHIKKLVDICYTFVHGKNDSWNRHVQYILIEKNIINFNYCVLTTSSPFSNFPGLIHIDQLSGSTMLPKEAIKINLV